MKGAERGRRKSVAREIAYIGVAVALVTVCAWVTVPIGPVPITLQTFAVVLVGALFGLKRGLAAIAAYILMGLIGIPVFSGFRAGTAALFGPTGGYIFGFLFLALLPALFKTLPVKGKYARAACFYGAAVLGMVFCYAFGTAWFMYMYRCTLGYALTVCVIPYLLPDAVKFFVAVLLAVRLEKFIH